MIRVFLKTENPELHRPQHSASKTLALLVLASYAARWTDQEKTAIQLTTSESWKEVKLRVRGDKTLGQRPIPQLNSWRSYQTMCLQSYPEPNRSSLIHPHQAFVDACRASKAGVLSENTCG